MNKKLLENLGKIELACVQEFHKKYGVVDYAICDEASEAVSIELKKAGIKNAHKEDGGFVGPGFEYGKSHPNPPAYWHKWVRLDDSTIIDAAVSQFSVGGLFLKSPLIVSPFDQKQDWYWPDTGGEEFDSGYLPIGFSKWSSLER